MSDRGSASQPVSEMDRAMAAAFYPMVTCVVFEPDCPVVPLSPVVASGLAMETELDGPVSPVFVEVD